MVVFSFFLHKFHFQFLLILLYFFFCYSFNLAWSLRSSNISILIFFFIWRLSFSSNHSHCSIIGDSMFFFTIISLRVIEKKRLVRGSFSWNMKVDDRKWTLCATICSFEMKNPMRMIIDIKQTDSSSAYFHINFFSVASHFQFSFFSFLVLC